MSVGSMARLGGKKVGTNGIWAYKVLQKWSLDISEEAKSDRMQKLMAPDQVKKEEEVADKIEA